MTLIADYLSEIRKSLTLGPTEHTHRPALKQLLEASGKDITATNEPKRILCGSPDFQITRKTVPLGHVETKDIGTNLKEMEMGKGPHGDQFKRYTTLPNWILTDYLEFRWFVAGEKRLTLRIADFDANGKLKPATEGADKLAQLLDAFFSQPALTVGTARELAGRMAGMTRIIRDLITATLKQEEDKTAQVKSGVVQEPMPGYGSRSGWLHNWLDAFRETLIPDLTESDFADMFAQTLAYGLFAARVHTPVNKGFSREMAAFNLPKTNPFLRKLFSEIAGVDMPDTIAWAVDDIVELLKHADMAEILNDFGKGKTREDPVIHFYETFLAAYDPKMRDVRGVRYTPEPVVSYIVRSIDHLLKTRFNRPKGLADEKTLILDPATGTATFHYFVIQLIYERFAGQKGVWNAYVEKHLLNRLFGFELLMAPYAIAHLKLGILLEETGYKFGSDQRLGIYLTNTLEEAAKKSDRLFAEWVAEEANAAAKVKAQLPIMVVLGNPPYANFGRMNRNKWILRLLDDYKKDLNEKKLNLDDDFIKFIRFAQWRIEKTGHGIVGFITSNTYLDGITHRRMRESLMQAFDEIYILDLHGSSKKKERTPDGGKDENVFDITVGVSILLAVRLADTGPPSDGRAPARVFHAELWGDRKGKYDWLWQNDASQTTWTELAPTEPYFFFVPKNFDLSSEYEPCWSVNEIFSVQQNCVKTDRDDLFFDTDRAQLQNRMMRFYSSADVDPEFTRTFRLEDSSSYDLLTRRAKTRLDLRNVQECLYRPFDTRWLYYAVGLTSRPAWDVMRHMIGGENFGLLAKRQSKREPFSYIWCARGLVESCVFESAYANNSIFPLYLIGDPNDSQQEIGGLHFRRPNLNANFLSAFAKKLNVSQRGKHNLPDGVTPEDIFHYAYAIFHSPAYRTRYAEFLKIDFPRLPLTNNLKLFRALAEKGSQLVSLHLMESPKLDDFITEFPEKGDNLVEKVRYGDKDKRVWINKTQYFAGVPEVLWNFHIGGYQVCEKWLKDRKGRTLAYDDIQHYQRIVVALKETIRLMAGIDKTIEACGGWPSAFITQRIEIGKRGGSLQPGS